MHKESIQYREDRGETVKQRKDQAQGEMEISTQSRGADRYEMPSSGASDSMSAHECYPDAGFRPADGNLGVKPADAVGQPVKPGAATKKEENHISPDKKWETMARPTGMLRYIPSGVFYVRLKYKGAVLGPKSLETDDYGVATERMPDYVKELKKKHENRLRKANNTGPTTWREAAAEVIRDSMNLQKLGSFQQGALQARISTIQKVEFFWPSIVETSLRTIKPADALEFMAEARSGTGRFVLRKRPENVQQNAKQLFLGGPEGASSFGRLLWTARFVTDKARKMDKIKGLGDFENPFSSIPRVPVRPSLPPLPNEEEFQRLLNEILTNDCHLTTVDSRFTAWAGVNFLSMTGARIGEVLGVWEGTYAGDDQHPGLLWSDIFDDVAEPYISFICAKKRKGDKWRRRRNVPFYGGKDGALAQLIQQLRARWYKGDSKAKVFQKVSFWYGFNAYLARACENCGLLDKDGKPYVITQHDLRHIFCTRCVEAGVTWKALAEWLGHEDGGILAASTYSCLRREHSFEMATRLGKKPGTVEPSDVMVDGKSYTTADIAKLIQRMSALEGILKG